jgi:hypothetical protein
VRPLKRAVTEQAHRILADALHRVLTLLIGNHEPGSSARMSMNCIG